MLAYKHLICLPNQFVYHLYYIAYHMLNTYIHVCIQCVWASQVAQCKESAWNAEDLGSIPGSGRSPGEGNGNPLLPGEAHGQRSLVGYSPMGLQRIRHN